VSSGFDGGALFDALARAGVRFVVIGGFAVIAHGVIRTTEDLDICPDPDPENLRRLAALLGAAARPQDLEDLRRLAVAHDDVGRSRADS
jgi:hypothetical protein